MDDITLCITCIMKMWDTTPGCQPLPSYNVKLSSYGLVKKCGGYRDKENISYEKSERKVQIEPGSILSGDKMLDLLWDQFDINIDEIAKAINNLAKTVKLIKGKTEHDNQ